MHVLLGILAQPAPDPEDYPGSVTLTAALVAVIFALAFGAWASGAKKSAWAKVILTILSLVSIMAAAFTLSTLPLFRELLGAGGEAGQEAQDATESTTFSMGIGAILLVIAIVCAIGYYVVSSRAWSLIWGLLFGFVMVLLARYVEQINPIVDLYLDFAGFIYRTLLEFLT